MSKIAIIGYGKLGFHLSKALEGSHQVTVFARNPKGGVSDLASMVPSAFDFILLTVPDHAIHEVANQLEASEAIVVHTAGSRPLTDLSRHDRIGVLYPLQTFSKERVLDFRHIQIFIEGTSETEPDIKVLADSISEHVMFLNSSKRAVIHLAAVFACNFSNHLFHIAERQLNEIGMTFQDILPLVNETFEKAKSLNPSNSQTGPAVRKDQVTIDQHMTMLKAEEQRIYQLITENIQRYH